MLAHPLTINIAPSSSRPRRTPEENAGVIADAVCIAKGLNPADSQAFRAQALDAAMPLTYINILELARNLQNCGESLVGDLMHDDDWYEGIGHPKMTEGTRARNNLRYKAVYNAADELDKIDVSVMLGFLVPPTVTRDTDDSGMTFIDMTDPDDPKFTPMVIPPESITRESLIAMVDDPDIRYTIEPSAEDKAVLDAFYATTQFWERPFFVDVNH